MRKFSLKKKEKKRKTKLLETSKKFTRKIVFRSLNFHGREQKRKKKGKIKFLKKTDKSELLLILSRNRISK